MVEAYARASIMQLLQVLTDLEFQPPTLGNFILEDTSAARGDTPLAIARKMSFQGLSTVQQWSQRKARSLQVVSVLTPVSFGILQARKHHFRWVQLICRCVTAVHKLEASSASISNGCQAWR